MNTLAVGAVAALYVHMNERKWHGIQIANRPCHLCGRRVEDVSRLGASNLHCWVTGGEARAHWGSSLLLQARRCFHDNH